MKILMLTLFMAFYSFCLSSQNFVNASFEGEPQDAVIPVGWHICSPNTTPDIFPGVWGVYKEPADGETYLGLITRPDGSYESIGQRLPLSLKKEVCYQMQFFLAHSNEYAGFSDAIKCRIWLGNSKKDRGQLIFESEAVEHTKWKQIQIEFKPEKIWKYLIIEAAFPDDNLRAKGNILLDQISSLRPCSQA